MKYQKILCEKCKKKVTEEWAKEKRNQRAYRLKVKQVGNNKKQKLTIKHL